MKRLFALLTALLLLTGCSQLETPPEDEDILFPLEEQADTTEAAALPEVFSLPYLSTQPLNPLACPDGMQQTVASLLYEGLFHLDTALAPQPVLCASYTYDAEALTYTLTLRPNAVFSDGSPLTAADVKKVVIQSDGGRSMGCYELDCTTPDGGEVKIFVDAVTGRQAEISV